MRLKLGIVMDPLNSIYAPLDGSLAMLFEAQRRQWEIYYMETGDLFCRDGVAYATTRRVKVSLNNNHWYDFLSDKETISLATCDIILMRKDPPFNAEYIYATYLLELAEKQGCLVVNKPQSLRDANEKTFVTYFPQCCSPTLIAKNISLLRDFITEQQDVIIKPLDGCCGYGVFYLKVHDHNINATLELLTASGTKFVEAQRFIPEILTSGDKRIIMIDGEPIPYAYARFPKPNNIRVDVSAEAKGKGAKLTERDYWICQQVGPVLREKGLLFVGLDVIGDYLTEINVTSPTLFRNIEAEFNISIMARFFDCLEKKISPRC